LTRIMTCNFNGRREQYRSRSSRIMWAWDVHGVVACLVRWRSRRSYDGLGHGHLHPRTGRSFNNMFGSIPCGLMKGVADRRKREKGEATRILLLDLKLAVLLDSGTTIVPIYFPDAVSNGITNKSIPQATLLASLAFCAWQKIAPSSRYTNTYTVVLPHGEFLTRLLQRTRLTFQYFPPVKKEPPWELANP